MLKPYKDHIGLWENELKDWVPGALFDAHAHTGPPGAVGEISPERQMVALTTFASLTWEQLHALYAHLYGGKTVSGVVVFPFPMYEVDIDRANRYIIDLMRHDPRARGFFLSHPTDVSLSIAEFKRAVREGVCYSGVKPYFDLLRKSNYETTMPEFIPEGLWELMNAEHLVLMLHTSGLGMCVPENQEYIADHAERYPNVKIVLAHMGRYLQTEQCLAFLDSDVPAHPNVYLETSSASRPEVYARALSDRRLWSRLVFGSDMPFAMLTGYEHWSPETGPTFITRDDYVWSDPGTRELPQYREEPPTYNTYHTIKALKDAVASLGLTSEEERELKERVFYRNAQEGLFQRNSP